VITGISPSRLGVGAQATVTITGSGFTPAATVDMGPGITAGVGSGSTATSLTVFLVISGSAPGGNHSVTVTEPGRRSNAVNFYVQIPTSVSIAADSQGSEAICGDGTECGNSRSTVWQVVDQDTPPQPIYQVMQVYDTVTIGLPNDFNVTLANITTTCPGNTGPCGAATNTSGQTQADINSICSAQCFSSAGCIAPNMSTAITQTWHAGGYPLRPNQITVRCDRVLLNGQ